MTLSPSSDHLYHNHDHDHLHPDLDGRIDSTQEDEGLFMKSWLQDRNESSNYNHNHKMMKMAGMASPEEISQLKQSDGVGVGSGSLVGVFNGVFASSLCSF